MIIHKSDDLEEKQALVKVVVEEEKQVLVGDKVVSLAAPST